MQAHIWFHDNVLVVPWDDSILCAWLHDKILCACLHSMICIGSNIMLGTWLYILVRRHPAKPVFTVVFCLVSEGQFANEHWLRTLQTAFQHWLLVANSLQKQSLSHVCPDMKQHSAKSRNRTKKWNFVAHWILWPWGNWIPGQKNSFVGHCSLYDYHWYTSHSQNGNILVIHRIVTY